MDSENLHASTNQSPEQYSQEVGLPDKLKNVRAGVFTQLCPAYFIPFIETYSLQTFETCDEIVSCFVTQGHMIDLHDDYCLTDVAYLAKAAGWHLRAAHDSYNPDVIAQLRQKWIKRVFDAYTLDPADSTCIAAYHIMQGEVPPEQDSASCDPTTDNTILIYPGSAVIIFEGKIFSVDDKNGIRYLRTLLLNPEINSLRELIQQTDGEQYELPEESVQYELGEHKGDVRSFIKEMENERDMLNAEWQEAGLEKRQEIEETIEKLDAHIRGAKGSHPRQTRSHAEKHGKRIEAAMRRALEKLTNVPEAKGFLEHIKIHLSGITYRPPYGMKWQ